LDVVVGRKSELRLKLKNALPKQRIKNAMLLVAKQFSYISQRVKIEPAFLSGYKNAHVEKIIQNCLAITL